MSVCMLDNGAHNEGHHKYEYFASSGISMYVPFCKLFCGCFHRNIGPLRGWKRSLHEGGHRTAMFVKWKGVVPEGRITNHQIAYYDMMSTFAELAGLNETTLPENDGLSAVPTLRGPLLKYTNINRLVFVSCRSKSETTRFYLS